LLNTKLLFTYTPKSNFPDKTTALPQKSFFVYIIRQGCHEQPGKFKH